MHSYSSHSDTELLALLKAGDEQAFTALYHRYWQPLFFVAHKRLSSADDSREIVQEVFLTLWRKREVLQIDTLSVYLAAMVRYAVYRHWSGIQRKAAHLKTIQNAGEQITAPIDIDNRQFLELLTRFANSLPRKYRLVFISHKLLDRPLDEVAAQLGVSPRTAEGYLSKVLEIMRNHREKIAFSIIVSFFS